MSDVITMDEYTWFDKYKPIPNTVPGGTQGQCGLAVGNEGYMYETYGPDLAFVQKIRIAESHCVWTQTEEDGVCIIQNGYHHINRMGYFITEIPFIPSTTASYLEVPLWDDNEELDPNVCELCEE